MARQRRQFNVFSLSFLDVMSCGFGAVVLIFLIINHDTQEDAEVVNKDLLSEVRLLDYQVTEGEADLFELKESLDGLLARISQSEQELVSTEASVEQKQEDFATLNNESLAKRKSAEELEADVRVRAEELKRLLAIKKANEGQQARTFAGDGDRQYLTGLRIGGRNILIALDASASMLDESIVNVLRRRNMSQERQRQAPKWQRAIRTVEWVVAQLPLEAEYQLLTFNSQPEPLTPNAIGEWEKAADQGTLDAAISKLQRQVSSGGSSLENLFAAVQRMSPLPDNVYLIIDSLPTQGERAPRAATVSGRERLNLFRKAMARLPKQVPINVIMFPMEGDPMAAASFWNVARTTGGSFISPSRDWP